MRDRTFELHWISEYKEEIYGFSILWIVLFHSIVMLAVPWPSFLSWFVKYGNIGVEIFLFCSGVFLFFSFAHCPQLNVYCRKRLIRLIIPVWITWIGFWIYECISLKQGVLFFVIKLSMLDFWVSGNQQIWFLSNLLILYFLYPFFYYVMYPSADCRNRRIVISGILLIGLIVLFTFSLRAVYPDTYQQIEIAVTRWPSFILGCMMGRAVYEQRKFPFWYALLAIPVFAGMIILLEQNLLSGIYTRYAGLFPAIAMLVIITVIFRLVNIRWIHGIFRFLGKRSIHLYCSHILVITIARRLGWKGHVGLAGYLGITAVSLGIAIGVYWINRKLSARLPVAK